MVISSETSTQLETETPIQIWVTAYGVGIWPDREHTLTVPELQRVLQGRFDDESWLSVRLLCEPQLSLQDWGPTALALSDIASEIRLAPLPE